MRRGAGAAHLQQLVVLHVQNGHVLRELLGVRHQNVRHRKLAEDEALRHLVAHVAHHHDLGPVLAAHACC